MKFYEGVLSSTVKNLLDFDGHLGNLTWVNEQKSTIIVLAYPDRGAGNYPEPLVFVYHHQGPTFLQWAIWGQWSIRLSQGSLCSLGVANVCILSMLNFKKPSLTATKLCGSEKATPKGSGLLPSPHPGYAVATILKWPFKKLLWCDLKNITKYITRLTRGLDAPTFLWKSAQHFLRFCIRRLFTKKENNYVKPTILTVEKKTENISELEALRERRPPWPRQIITPILSTVKMLSLGCERLPTPLKKKKKGFWIITFTTIWVCYHYYGVLLLIYSSYNTQITTKI